MIISILFLMLLLLLSMDFDVVEVHENQLSAIKAKDAVNEIFKACQLTYQEGRHARTKVFVYIPKGVEGTSVDNGVLLMNVSLSGHPLTVSRKVQFPVQGAIPSEYGYYWINVTSYGDYVRITY